MRPWSQLQYPSRFQPVPANPADAVEPVWFESWVQPIERPVLPLEYRYTIPYFFRVADPSEFAVIVEVITVAAWVQPTQWPFKLPEYRYQMPSIFYQQEPGIAFVYDLTNALLKIGLRPRGQKDAQYDLT